MGEDGELETIVGGAVDDPSLVGSLRVAPMLTMD